MTIDMTVTSMTTANNPASQQRDLSYEVECEISKIDHLVQFAGDEIAFRSIIRRFLQNVASLTHLLADSRRRAKDKQVQVMAAEREHRERVERDNQILEEHRRRAAEAFSSYYGIQRQVKPICGDYLANVALVMLEESKDQREQAASASEQKERQK